jgi:hypothetical protein
MGALDQLPMGGKGGMGGKNGGGGGRAGKNGSIGVGGRILPGVKRCSAWPGTSAPSLGSECARTAGAEEGHLVRLEGRGV